MVFYAKDQAAVAKHPPRETSTAAKHPPTNRATGQHTLGSKASARKGSNSQGRQSIRQWIHTRHPLRQSIRSGGRPRHSEQQSICQGGASNSSSNDGQASVTKALVAKHPLATTPARSSAVGRPIAVEQGTHRHSWDFSGSTAAATTSGEGGQAMGQGIQQRRLQEGGDAQGRDPGRHRRWP
jgi:hypothetical protein